MTKQLVGAMAFALLTSTSMCLAQDGVAKASSNRGVVSSQSSDIPCEVPSKDGSAEHNVADDVVSADATKPASETFKVLYLAFALAPFYQPANDQLSTTPGQPGLLIHPADPQQKGFNWSAASRQSALLLAFLHGVRFNQAKTRRELKGPFFRDYVRSVKGLKGWGDGDDFATNYLGHPAMGSVSGYIQIHNDPTGVRQQISWSKAYWKSRFKALGWSTAFSTQFELGLFSEATIGNVGKKPGTAGFVDLIVTPTLGTATIVLEDAADAYIVKRIERRTSNTNVVVLARSLLNPTRSVANLLRFQKPWHRDRRIELPPSQRPK